MKLLSTLIAAAFSLSSLSLAASSDYAVFNKYKPSSLSSTPITINDAKFEELTKKPRHHGLVLTLTALDAKFQCAMCQEFHKDWKVLSKSWARGDPKGDSKLIFATIEFKDGKETFRKLGLETAPVLFYFPPTAGPHAKPSATGEPARYDFQMAPSSAEDVHRWLIRQLPETSPKPRVHRPTNWLLVGGVTLGAVTVLTVLLVAWPYVIPLLQNRNVWAAASIIAVLLFTSGHMFNHIRGAAYVSGDGKGGVQYFAPGFQNQYGLESQIVAGLYAVLAFSTIALALKVPRMADPTKQQAAVFIWGAVMYGVYSFLLSIFRAKNQGYPFFLPPF